MVGKKRKKVEKQESSDAGKAEGKAKKRLPNLKKFLDAQNTLAVAVIAIFFGLIIGVAALPLIILPPVDQSGTCEVCEVEVLQPTAAASKVLDYINANLLAEGVVAENAVAEFFGTALYKVTFSIPSEAGADEANVFVSVDGKTMFIAMANQNMFDLDVAPPKPEPEGPPPEYTEGDKQNLSEFVSCLGENGFEIYGSTGCGWTMLLIDSLGGLEITGPIFIDCGATPENCTSDKINGYPTMMINGEVYGASLESRSILEMAAATGCEVPVLSVDLSEYSGGGTCS